MAPAVAAEMTHVQCRHAGGAVAKGGIAACEASARLSTGKTSIETCTAVAAS
jgi:hypothetical protein